MKTFPLRQIREATARALGVRVIKVERDGEPAQHIDLCGKPLERAMERARKVCSVATCELPLDL